MTRGGSPSQRARQVGILAVIVTAVATGPVHGQRAGSERERLPADIVYLRDIDPSIAQDIRYATTNNFTGRPLAGYQAAECLLRRDVALALRRVQAELAPSGLALKVYDCYRPRRAVAAMVAWTRDKGPDGASRAYYPRVERRNLLAGYIAIHSRHSTGTAIDLTLTDRGVPVQAPPDPAKSFGPCNGPADRRAPDSGLDMGTAFDCFDADSVTASKGIDIAAQHRRKLLVGIMTKHGFRNYSREWWHFALAGTEGAASYDVPIRPHPASPPAR